MSAKRSTHSLEQSSLFRLVRRRRLAELIGLTDAQLRYVTKYADTLYREFDQPKKNGTGTRHIEDPTKLLKDAQGNRQWRCLLSLLHNERASFGRETVSR